MSNRNQSKSPEPKKNTQTSKASQPPKKAEKKPFNPADYERLGLPKEDIIEIK
jgi:hypothetical protein